MVKVASPEGNNQSHNWLDLLGRGLFPPHESKGKGRVAGNQNDRDLDFRDLPTLQQKAEQRQEKESRMSKFLKNSVDLAVEAATESSEAGALRSIANGNNFESQASHNHSLGNIAGKGGALESLEGSLRWVELELVTISLRCKEDLDEIAFWRFAPHQEIERARKHLREMIRLEEESELEEGGAGGPEVFTENKGVVPRLAKRVANGELNQDEQVGSSVVIFMIRHNCVLQMCKRTLATLPSKDDMFL